MELVERYVKAVSRRLPASQRASVEAELRAAILDALEGRGAQTEDDVVAVLRDFGEPAQVAASYDPRGQYLIGPELYPSFLRTLRLVVIAVLALHGLWFVLDLARGEVSTFALGDALWDALESAFFRSLIAAGIVTGSFVLRQRSGSRVSLERRAPWDPRALPALPEADRSSRVETAFTLVVTLVFATIIGAMGREAAQGYESAPEAFRPILSVSVRAVLPLLMASLVIEAMLLVVVLVEGRWRTWTRGVRVFADALAVAGLSWAAFVVSAQRGELVGLGVPSAGVTSAVLTLAIIAAVVVVDTTVREVKAQRARKRERAAVSDRSADPSARPGGDRPTPPTARTATA